MAGRKTHNQTKIPGIDPRSYRMSGGYANRYSTSSHRSSFIFLFQTYQWTLHPPGEKAEEKVTQLFCFLFLFLSIRHVRYQLLLLTRWRKPYASTDAMFTMVRASEMFPKPKLIRYGWIEWTVFTKLNEQLFLPSKGYRFCCNQMLNGRRITS